MARRASSNGISKSEEIRQLLKETPDIDSKTAVAKLAEKGVTISNALFYFVKGQIKGRKARKKEDRNGNVRTTSHADSSITVSSILKLKSLADELGGMKRLKVLVDALSE